MSRLGGVSEGIGQANSFDRLLGDAIVNLRSIEFQDIKNSWHNIDSVTELRPDTALFLDAIRPVYYHWVVSSAFMAGPLVELVGGVVGHSPSQRIGRVRQRSANLIDLGKHSADIGYIANGQEVVLEPGRVSSFGNRVCPHDRVSKTIGVTLWRCAVIRYHHYHGVIELAALLQVIQEPSNLLISVIDVCGVNLSKPCINLLLVFC